VSHHHAGNSQSQPNGLPISIGNVTLILLSFSENPNLSDATDYNKPDIRPSKPRIAAWCGGKMTIF